MTMFYVNDRDAAALRRMAAQSRGMQRIHPAPQRRARRVGKASETQRTTTDLVLGVITKKLMGATGLTPDEWGEGEAQMYTDEGEKDGDPIIVYNRSADEVNIGIPCRFSGDEMIVPYCYPLPI